jgi:hypothetical protein
MGLIPLEIIINQLLSHFQLNFKLKGQKDDTNKNIINNLLCDVIYNQFSNIFISSIFLFKTLYYYTGK